MARVPQRTREVYFLGAGFSKAFGLPLTSELLSELEVMAAKYPNGHLNTGHPPGQDFRARLSNVMRALYPDGHYEGYRPGVVDFFASLSTYVDLSESFTNTSFPGGKPRAFLHQLKRGIARILIEKTREALDSHSTSRELERVVRPGVIAVTSNWDLLLESYAQMKGIPLRRSLSTESDRRADEFTLLKLHGSVDWLRTTDKRASYPESDFRPIGTLSMGFPERSARLRKEEELCRVVSAISNTWQRVSARAEVPHMVTMATGKIDDLGPLRQVWRDAYSVISMAKNLRIVGYSMPPDDTEIRTLLRAGVKRGTTDPTVHVTNPSPDVHDRVRRYVSAKITSNYSAVEPRSSKAR